MKKTIETVEYRLPIYWASALINGDFSGCSDEEEKEIKDFINEESKKYKLFWCVDVEEVGFCWGNDANSLGGDCGEYTFHVETTPEIVDGAPKARNEFLDNDYESTLVVYAYETLLNGQFGQLKAIYNAVVKYNEWKGFDNDMLTELTKEQYHELLIWFERSHH